MSRTLGAIIIGDEILSGKRQDKHFAKIAEMLGARGLRLSWVEYLGDDRARLTATFKRTMAAGDIVFSCGGIGNTPDDHTRQAVAAALGVDLVLHPAGYEELKARFNGEEINDHQGTLVGNRVCLAVQQRNSTSEQRGFAKAMAAPSWLSVLQPP